MKRRHLLWMVPLLAPLLLFLISRRPSDRVVAPSDDGAVIIATLSREVANDPQRQRFTVHSYVSLTGRFVNWLTNDDISHHVTTYDRAERRLTCAGMWDWFNVSDESLHSAARDRSGWPDMKRYGATGGTCCV